MSVIDRIAFLLISGAYSLAASAQDLAESARAVLWAFIWALVLLVAFGAALGRVLVATRSRLVRAAVVTATIAASPVSMVVFWWFLKALSPKSEGASAVFMHPKLWVPMVPSAVGLCAFAITFALANRQRSSDELHRAV